jgi:hypothetical protein
VKALLGLVEAHPDVSPSLSPTYSEPETSEHVTSLESLTKPHQPSWASVSDLTVALDYLANLYAATSRPEVATALYSRALSLVDPSESCKKAALENNIAECYVAVGRVEDGT